MKHNFWILGAALALGITLAGCSGGDSASSGSTLAEAASAPAGSSSQLAQESSSSAPIVQEEPERKMMTVDEAVEYFMRLNPADLGLPGESMEAFQVYPSEKAVPVDGLPCMKLIVYADSAAGTNSPEGTFLLARDGTAVYKLDGKEAVQLEIG